MVLRARTGRMGRAIPAVWKGRVSEQGTPDVLRLLAEAESLPQDELSGEAPPAVAYDAGLIAELEEHGPAALKEYGKITVRNTSQPERYAAALWYALKHGLHYEQVAGAVLITDPEAEAGER